MSMEVVDQRGINISISRVAQHEIYMAIVIYRDDFSIGARQQSQGCLYIDWVSQSVDTASPHLQRKAGRKSRQVIVGRCGLPISGQIPSLTLVVELEFVASEAYKSCNTTD